MTIGPVIGTCVFCSLQISYAQPPVPGQAYVDSEEIDTMDSPHPAWANFELVDQTGNPQCFGAGAKHEEAAAVGQIPHHALPGKPIG